MKQKGFTLIELIITITLVSVILVIILGGLRLSINAWETGEERIEVYQRMRSVLRQMSHDIESVFLFYYKKDKLKPKRYLAFKGSPNSFSIISSTKGLDPDKKMGAGIREVTYSVKTDQKGRRSLIRRERFIHPKTVFAKRDSLELSIIHDVAWIRMKYYRVKYTIFGEEQPVGWSGSFTGVLEFEENQSETKIRNILPRAIEVTISLLEKKKGKIIENLLPPLIIPINAGKEITVEVTTLK